MKQIRTTPEPPKQSKRDTSKRSSERRAVTLPARLTWKDQQGTTCSRPSSRATSASTGVCVERQNAVSIPPHRLVQFQLERDGRESDALPASLARDASCPPFTACRRIEVGAASGSRCDSMVDPRRSAAAVEQRAPRV